MLSNIAVGRATGLQSFLLGQPQFREVLGNSALDQLRQRITAAYHLGPLNEADTRGYIEHRLRCAGWQGDPEFSEDCFGAIYRHTGGVPRRINTLCSRLLLCGFLDGSHTITTADADQVAAELEAELSSVATANRTANGHDAPAADGVPVSALCERLDSLERRAAGHDRAIRRVIEIMASYFAAGEANEAR
jgi:hypothetical protein